jgi:hypothetical protein
MESILIILTLGLLGLLVALLVFLLITQQHGQGINRRQRDTQSKAPTPTRGSSPQSEKTSPATTMPASPMTHAFGPAQGMVPDRSRFATEGSVLSQAAHMAFTEVIAQQTSQHSYAHAYTQSPKSPPPKFETGPLPQVPGYRFVNGSGKPFGTFTLYKALSLAEDETFARNLINNLPSAIPSATPTAPLCWAATPTRLRPMSLKSGCLAARCARP